MAKIGSLGKNLNNSAVGSAGGGQQISSEERQRMIAEAAYFRAMQRGFNGGNPVDDWLVAEREINRQLPARRQQK
jgi:hypothetical protein